MADNIPVRVSGPQFRYDYEWYEQGDELEVDEETLEKYPRRIERIDESDGEDDATADETAPEDDSDDAEELEVDPHPSELTVDELESRVQDVDDVAMLEAILDAEKETEPRTTAVDAIEDRIVELRLED